MRIGIFGGSFDPVHIGHLVLAESCREQLDLSEVRFTPSSIAPHKQEGSAATGRARLEMLNLAIAGHAAFRVWPAELDRGGVSYTVDTLRRASAEQPGAELLLLMGADSLADLPSWREPAAICELALPAVVGRPAAAAVDFTVLQGVASPERIAAMRDLQVESPFIEISSSDLRSRVAAGRSIRFLTPRAVEKYIETSGLYRGREPGK